MAEYKEIKGFQVQTRSEDPTPYAQALADNPYGGTWSSGGAMNTARRDLSAAGIQTAALGIGGYISDYSALNENYNGSSWTEVNDLNVAKRGLAGFGSSTAAIVAGGYGSPTPLATTESWNGSSWT